MSGFTSPIDHMPLGLQYVTWFNPVRHFMEISRGIFLKDIDILSVGESLFPLVVIAMITFGASVWMFRRKTSLS
ncbi:MAG: ABC transporter permease [Verrucomicrobiota bacterium]|nr:ABC transporter permease [Verrucomicrobiota bacterium]